MFFSVDQKYRKSKNSRRGNYALSRIKLQRERHTPHLCYPVLTGLSVQSKLFQEKSKPLQESKSTFIWWKVKERRVNNEILSNQIKPNSGKDTMLCFQISVFSLIFEGCVMRNFSLFIYINIFIYINNNIFSKMDASKTKLKSEIWKQKHTAFSFQLSVLFLSP